MRSLGRGVAVGPWGLDPVGTSSLRTGAESEAALYCGAAPLWGPRCPQSYVGRACHRGLST